MKTVFLIVGESASGKDSFVNEICKELGYKQLTSYATRPKREGEGNTHIFIFPEEVNQYTDSMIAYTKIGEYEYFATVKQLYDSDFYVIDPNGVDYMKFITQYKGVDDIRFVTIYINTPSDIRKDRAISTRKDDKEVYLNRSINELSQFSNFKACAKFDYSISNIDFNKAYDIFKYIVNKELN